jgi:multisubunit Na+/H+ antiporter MnhG subunit
MLGATATVTLICITALLMAFSLIAWVLDNTTLAAIAGTAGCTLAADIGRRLLGSSGHDAGNDPDHRALVGETDKPSAGAR